MENVENTPEIYEIEQLTDTITLRNASSNFNLDKNLTKSRAMAELKQRMKKVANFDFRNLTKNVLEEKDSNLNVPISVSVLLRWAIKNDLKVNDDIMEIYFTVEKILTQLTVIIYPQSLAGMNLKHNEIELLLKRIKYETYLNKSGWDIIRCYDSVAKGSFDYNQGKNKNYYSLNRNLFKSSSIPTTCQPFTE